MTNETPNAKEYSRRKLLLTIASFVIGIAYLCIMIGGASDWLAQLAARVAENRYLQVIVYGALYVLLYDVAMLPTSFASGYVLEHRYQLSRQTLGAWLWKHVKAALLGLGLGVPLILGLYALVWAFPNTWWIWVAVAWFGVTVLLGQLAPVLIMPLFYKTERLTDEGLVARFKALVDGTGLKIKGIYRFSLGKETRKANAALAGLGRTRRVLLGDTLLDEYTPDEIDVVLAHEVGHHVHGHIWKLLGLGAVSAAAGFWICQASLASLAEWLGFGDYRAIAAFPLFMLVLTILGLILLPLENLISRRFERQSDAYALERTGQREAFISAFEKLAQQNLTDMSPHPLVVCLFYSHPPIPERIKMARELELPSPESNEREAGLGSGGSKFNVVHRRNNLPGTDGKIEL